jgi:hypothetical protein
MPKVKQTQNRGTYINRYGDGGCRSKNAEAICVSLRKLPSQEYLPELAEMDPERSGSV